MNKNIEMYWKKRFDESALNFENDADIGLWSKHGFERRFVTFFRVFQENYFTDGMEGKKLLDVGCGSGAYDGTLADMGYSVVGVDYSEHVIKKAVEKSKEKNIPYIVGALPFLPFGKESFDIVICIGVFQNIRDEDMAIGEFAGILKENGRIILMTLNSLSIYAVGRKMLQKLDFFMRKNDDSIVYDRRYSYFELRNVLKGKGFNNFKFHGIYVFPKPLIFLEEICKETPIFKIIDKIPFVSPLLAHAFIIKADKEE